MVHNWIEYWMLAAYGEGFEIMKGSEFDLDLLSIAGLWRYGSVVRSWLLELLARALQTDGDDLAKVAGYVDDSGTGRWTVEYAVANAIPIPGITTSVYERFASREDERFAMKVIAALRVAEVRVAAVDQDVAGGEQAHERRDRVLGDVAGGDHDPHDAR